MYGYLVRGLSCDTVAVDPTSFWIFHLSAMIVYKCTRDYCT